MTPDRAALIERAENCADGLQARMDEGGKYGVVIVDQDLIGCVRSLSTALSAADAEIERLTRERDFDALEARKWSYDWNATAATEANLKDRALARIAKLEDLVHASKPLVMSARDRGGYVKPLDDWLAHAAALLKEKTDD